MHQAFQVSSPLFPHPCHVGPTWDRLWRGHGGAGALGCGAGARWRHLPWSTERWVPCPAIVSGWMITKWPRFIQFSSKSSIQVIQMGHGIPWDQRYQTHLGDISVNFHRQGPTDPRTAVSQVPIHSDLRRGGAEPPSILRFLWQLLGIGLMMVNGSWNLIIAMRYLEAHWFGLMFHELRLSVEIWGDGSWISVVYCMPNAFDLTWFDQIDQHLILHSIAYRYRGVRFLPPVATS
jgi:hypothetical protein